MSDQRSEKVSILMVFIFILLMISFVFVQIEVFDFYQTQDYTDASQKQENYNWGEIEDIKASKAMYASLKSEFYLPHFVDKSVPQRTLKSFNSLRAYNGAPPVIPHPIIKSKSLTGDSCLGCHQNGGFTPKFNAYAPIVPHPEKLNCRQCHNPRNKNSLFKKTKWGGNSGKRGFAHLPGSPLIIPHSLQMRESCLSCHSGPAAVKEIRTTHPERVNCMQCHVERHTAGIWVRK